jgi:glycopeptide antibiotics resistance protein
MLNALRMLKSLVAAIPLSALSALVTALIIKQYQKRTGITLKKQKRNAIMLLVPYIVMMLQLAILFRPFGSVNEIDIIPFNTPGGIRYIVMYAAANAIAFLPVGLLIPMIWENMDSLRQILMVGFLSSFFIELSQLILQCGVCQTEDLIMNTLGAGMGYWIYIKRNHRG